jgi:hypothetical protein
MIHKGIPMSTLIAKLALGAAVVGGVVGTVGLASAAWQSTGSGAAAASAVNAVNSVIVPGATAGLYPGAVKTVTVSVSNPNAYPVMVTSISAGSSAAVGGTACTANTVATDAVAANPGGVPQYDAVTQTNSGPVAIPAAVGPTQGTATYELTVRMANAADNSCQGQTFSMAISSTLVSAASTVNAPTPGP